MLRTGTYATLKLYHKNVQKTQWGYKWGYKWGYFLTRKNSNIYMLKCQNSVKNTSKNTINTPIITNKYLEKII